MFRGFFVLNSCLVLLISNHSYSNNKVWNRFNYPKIQEMLVVQQETNFEVPVSANEVIPNQDDQDDGKIFICCTGSACCAVSASCACACYNYPCTMTGACCLGCCYAGAKCMPAAIWIYSRLNISPKKME